MVEHRYRECKKNSTILQEPKKTLLKSDRNVKNFPSIRSKQNILTNLEMPHSSGIDMKK